MILSVVHLGLVSLPCRLCATLVVEEYWPWPWSLLVSKAILGEDHSEARSYMSQAKADQATDFLARLKALISLGVGSDPGEDCCGV